MFEISNNFLIFLLKNSAIKIYNEMTKETISNNPNDITKLVDYNTLIYPNDRIILNSKKLSKPVERSYLLYKPYGITSSIQDESKISSINSLLSTQWLSNLCDDTRLTFVGRLDKNSYGLILCTNDGILSSILRDTNVSNMDKIYRVNVKRRHKDTRFSQMLTLASSGAILKRDLYNEPDTLNENITGIVNVNEHNIYYFDKVISKGRCDTMEMLGFQKMDDDEDALKKNELKFKNENELDKKIPLKVSKDEMLQDIKDEYEVSYDKYVNSIKRQTQWNIITKHGKNKIIQHMIKSKGFDVTRVERIGYGPFTIENDFKHWNWNDAFLINKTEQELKQLKMYGINYDNIIKEFDEKEINEDVNRNIISELCKYNSIQLNSIQKQKLWDYIGGRSIGINLKLKSLLEKGFLKNDLKFFEWLNKQYSIRIKL